MKLSTKTLFTALKSTPKKKFKIIHKQKKSFPLTMPNKASKNNNYIYNSNSNLKQNLFFNTINVENPFKQPQMRTSRLTSKKINRIINSKNKKIEIEILKTEDSYINNILLTNESDTDRYEDKIEKENKDTNKIERNKDTHHNLFRKSNLRSTIIIDNKGNNNLDSEQKKIINNYFNKKNSFQKLKINTVPLQKYKENNIVFKSKKDLFTVNNEIKRNLTNCFFKSCKETKIRRRIKKNIVHQKLLSTKDKIDKKCIIGELFDIMSEKEKSETEGNSIFENWNNNSIDSSFLGSSLNDDFYMGLTNTKT